MQRILHYVLTKGQNYLGRQSPMANTFSWRHDINDDNIINKLLSAKIISFKMSYHLKAVSVLTLCRNLRCPKFCELWPDVSRGMPHAHIIQSSV